MLHRSKEGFIVLIGWRFACMSVLIVWCCHQSSHGERQDKLLKYKKDLGS